MSIKGHRVDGELLVLSLRSGGEVVCEPATIVRFMPDEVPYPEPETVVLPMLPAIAGELVPFGEIIESVAAEHGVPARLVRAVIKVESDYQEHARSPKGAMGLMQLMPDTAKRFAVDSAEVDIKTPAEIRKMIPADLAKWDKVARDAGMAKH